MPFQFSGESLLTQTPYYGRPVNFPLNTQIRNELSFSKTDAFSLYHQKEMNEVEEAHNSRKLENVQNDRRNKSIRCRCNR